MGMYRFISYIFPLCIVQRILLCPCSHNTFVINTDLAVHMVMGIMFVRDTEGGNKIYFVPAGYLYAMLFINEIWEVGV